MQAPAHSPLDSPFTPRLVHSRRIGPRAIGAAGLFALWIVVTVLGSRFEPAGGYSFGTTLLALAAYSVLTAVTLLRVALTAWDAALYERPSAD